MSEICEFSSCFVHAIVCTENANYAYKLVITIATTSWYKQIVPEAYNFFSNDTSEVGSVVRKHISGDFHQLKHRSSQILLPKCITK